MQKPVDRMRRVLAIQAAGSLLAEGSHLWIELKPDGTSDGEFFTPEGAAPQPQERRVSMEGTWSVNGANVVTFVMEGDTYVQLGEWRFGADKLENVFSIGGYKSTTILRR
jgi:hypothetical protein